MQHSIAWRRTWTATTQSHQALILQHYLTARQSTRYNWYIYIYISLSQLSIESAELQIVSLGYPLPEGLVGNDCGTYHRSRFFRHRSPVKNAIRRQEQCTRYYNSLKLAFAEGHCNSARCAGEGHRDWWIGPIGGGWPWWRWPVELENFLWGNWVRLASYKGQFEN